MERFDRSQTEGSTNGADRNTLYLLGGVALVVFGAGLILSNATVRRFLGQVGLGNLTQGGTARLRAIHEAPIDVVRRDTSE